MVGLEAHLRNLDSLLCLECDEVKMIGIWGPAGIGKTTIARALYNQLSSSYQFICFMGNLRGIYKSIMDVDDYDLKLCLQSKLLSKILNQKDMRVNHLGAVKEWLQDQRVLIVLDDVDDLEQLEVLAKELSWFGSGSPIIVTTKDTTILKAHGITDIYHVDFPSKKEALEILCLSAFKQSSVPDGFDEFAYRVAKLCGDLPLGLCVVGSSLRGESKHEWELQLSRLETCLDRKIEQVLRVGYDKLLKKQQSLFLHIAFLFNNDIIDHVTTMLNGSNLDVANGLKTLASKSLVHISIDGRIVMHYLLQQLGRQIVLEQSNEPGSHQFLVEVEEICDVLENETGTGSVIGISLDTSKIGNNGKFSVGKGAFEGMRNLRFLRIYRSWFGGEVTLQIPEDMKYLPCLRSLHWDSYPRKNLPPTFQPECLVELHMSSSNLEKLWGGIQPLPNLKSIDLSRSYKLKEIPNLLNATNLETLTLVYCSRLVELPSSIRNLHKLKKLMMRDCKKLRVIPTNINLVALEEFDMSYCLQLRSFPDISMNIRHLDVGSTKIEEIPSSIRNLHKLKKLKMGSCKKLRVIPTNINLASLEEVNMSYCSQLRNFPDISSNITKLSVKATKIKCVPPSMVRCWYHLECLEIGSRSLKTLTHVPLSVRKLDLSTSDVERIPDCVIRLPHLVDLIVEKCQKLMSIPTFSPSIEFLNANECASLKTVCCSFHNKMKIHSFYNCLQLDEEARREIIQQSVYDYICLPGKEIPTKFNHKATGSSITISLATFSASTRFKACILVLPIKDYRYLGISCHLRSKGGVTINRIYSSARLSDLFPRSEHLFIFSGDLCNEVDVTMSEIIFEFSCRDNDDKIIECGVQIMTEEVDGSSSSQVDNFETESSRSELDNFETGNSSSELDYYESESSSGEVDYHESGGGDEDYEAEGFKLSQEENVKTSKHTCFRSWLRKLGLKRRG